ncbi:BnaCnng44480D [Brassica napus]|uniref:BnaCnng44480D protein n=2 Tax=Brassica TaxID=3705 RepID=A0A078JDB9_BRANA|nr:BnaCnng44480D [Brassica napus]VDD07428.1 unnamed protein product [Brassica oleracea]
MWTMISNLPNDMVVAIMSRVPLKSLREVRLTCKKWNDLSKTQSFREMHIGKASTASKEDDITFCDFRLTGIMVWNMYLREKRWIKPRFSYRPSGWDMFSYVLGYKDNKKNMSSRLKLSRFIDNNDPEYIPVFLETNFRGNSEDHQFVEKLLGIY